MTNAAVAATEQVELTWDGRRTLIEHAWIRPAEPAPMPLLVFLHEGLGSCSAWRDFPQRLCDAAGCRGLVYSRPGYGRSSPRAQDQAWAPDFMHRQAVELLPALLRALGVDAMRERPWLFGHSDGGSIALLHAAAFPQAVGGLILMAPHIVVEELSIASIAQAREAYRAGDLRARLAQHHDDPDSAFWGWNDAWLNPAFGRWSIEHELASIDCPVLAIQGVDDAYGTLEQIRGIRRALPGTELLELQACGHAPHRDQREQVIAASTAFLQRWTPAGDTR